MLDQGTRNSFDNMASFGLGPSMLGLNWDGSKPKAQQPETSNTDYSALFQPLYQPTMQQTLQPSAQKQAQTNVPGMTFASSQPRAIS